MTFKEKIIKLRKQKGLTQDDFASAVGVSRQAVYKWESGQSYPEAQKLLEIKKLFDISIDDLLDDSFDVIVPEKKKRRRLPKEVKAEVEAQTLSGEAPATLEAPVEAPAVKEPVSDAPVEAVSEPEIPATEEFAPAEPVAESAPTESSKESASADESSEGDPDEPKRKVGFFGRIFGRK